MSDTLPGNVLIYSFSLMMDTDYDGYGENKSMCINYKLYSFLLCSDQSNEDCRDAGILRFTMTGLRDWYLKNDTEEVSC